MLTAELAVLEAVLATIDAQGSVDAFIAWLTDIYPRSDPLPLPLPKPVKLVKILVARSGIQEGIATRAIKAYSDLPLGKSSHKWPDTFLISSS
jgi:hypothetical protein